MINLLATEQVQVELGDVRQRGQPGFVFVGGNMRKLLAEAIGMFMLVAAICGAAVVSLETLAGSWMLGVALAAGGSIMVMMYALAPISGGHFNPAVTCGLLAAGRFPVRSVGPYIIAQIIGGILGALLIVYVMQGKIGWSPGNFAANGFGAHSPAKFPASAGFASETVLSAILVFVFCRVTREKGIALVMAPVVVGTTFALLHLVSMPVTGTSLNPARSTATAMFAESWAVQQLWMFWAAPLLGGVVGGIADRAVGDVS